ncbi:MAG: SurA N-terminal domain-containing protein [Proteobacteria bacterium]|nr:SurA N-terminal domain-containing protein [Pseudomonadota bacterium]
MKNILYLLFFIFLPCIVNAEADYWESFLSKDLDLKSFFSADGRIIDGIVVEVNNDPYTLIDLFNFVNSRGEKVDSLEDLTKDQSTFKRYLHDFILEELFKRDASQSGINVSDEEINAYVQEIKRQNNVSDEGFNKILKEKDLTVADYKNQVKSDILKTRLISQKVKNKINILDTDIENEAILKGNYTPSEDEVMVEQIFYKYENGISVKQKQSIKDEVLNIRNQIISGKSMQDVAADLYSNLGFVKVQDLKDELVSKIKHLEADKISDIIETENGLYLLKVGDKRQNQKLMSDELKEKYKRELIEAKFQENLKKYLSTELPKKFNLQILL